MSDMTPLDLAHAAMESAPDDAAARMRFYQRLADSEVFLLLSGEMQGDDITPEVFELSENSFVLVFDREERLADFVGRAAPYAAMSGRGLVAMLAGQGIGLGVNLEVAPSSILLPPDAVEWLVQTLAPEPEQSAETPREMRAPKGVSEAVLGAIDAKLAQAAGLAKSAYLVEIIYENGDAGVLLGVVDAPEGARAALAKSVSEAAVFSGFEARLDVSFFDQASQEVARLAKVGLRFDVPEMKQKSEFERPAPGSDPDKPPILR